MLLALLVILIVLWAIGFLPAGITIPNITFFALNGRAITLFDFITLIVISWIIGILPNPFRLIASVVLVLWVLSILGIFVIEGLALSTILVAVIIIGLLFYLIRGVFV